MKRAIVSLCVALLCAWFVGAPGPAAAQSAELKSLVEIQARHEAEVLAIPGVVGIGIGPAADADRLEFKLYVSELDAAARQAIPRDLEGVPVKVEVTGRFAPG